MKIKILAFGIAKEIFSSASINEDLMDQSNVKDLKEMLKKKFPQLKQLSSFRIAVNNHFASDDEIIAEQDEIAVIPPVSGG